MSRRLLFVSNLFPSADQPIRGLDNATLLHALRDRGDFEIRALALRPDVLGRLNPATRPRPGDGAFAPEYVAVRYVPRIGSRWNDGLARRDLDPVFHRIVADFRPEVVLAAWIYPDGCAVAALCRAAGLPCVLIAQGSDVHGYLNHPVRRKKIVAAVASTQATICRSGDLARRLREAGAPGEKLSAIYNGVDTDLFRTQDRAAARAALGIDADRPLLLFVGNLLPVKDPLFLIRAVAELNQQRRGAGLVPADLRLIGEGPLRPKIEREIARLSAVERIALLGRQPPESVARWMSSADALCLSSVNEGFPNVILEAMACGLPVVSTDVGGIAEKVGREAAGCLVMPGDAEGYLTALASVLTKRETGPQTTSADLGWPAAAGAYAATTGRAIRDFR